MDTTPTRDPSRTGALWVAGTGVFLLVAAAAVFVAVRWTEIPDAAKLGAVSLLTGVCLVAGRGLRRPLPTTSGALFHLGAFLIPVDVAALVIDRGAAGPTIVLVEGLVGIVAFSLLSRLEDSVALRVAVGLSGVVTAVGIAASADGGAMAVDASAVLVAMAGVAAAMRLRALALAWAIAAGLAPLVPSDTLFPALTGTAASSIIGLEAHRRRSLALVATAAGVAVVGVGATWSEMGPTWQADVVALGAVFVAVEVAALAVRRDPFWVVPGRHAALAVEVLSAGGVAAAMTTVVLAPADASRSVAGATAYALLALAWVVADRRGSAAGHWPATVAVPLGLTAAASTAGGPTAAAVTMIGLAALAALSARRGSAIVLAGLVVWAPLTALATASAVAVGCGVAGSLLCAHAAGRRAGAGEDPALSGDVAWRLGGWALGPAALTGVATAELAPASSSLLTGAVAFVVVAWAVGIALDPTRHRGRTRHLFLLPRAAAVGGLLVAPDLEPAHAAALAGLLLVASAVDAYRLGEVQVALGASLALPVGVVGTSLAVDATWPEAGLVLCLAAVVTAALSALAPPAWRRPPIAATLACLVPGLALASLDPTTIGPALLVAGGLVVGVGLVERSIGIGVVGGIVAVAGTWVELGWSGIGATDAYALPVAVVLVSLGASVRATGGLVSSWVAYGPAITLVGGTALAERWDGGGGWHSVLAGTVGVVAVAVGGHRRLGAPMLLGTGMLVAVAVTESLSVTRGVPTWAWLALGGSLLLGAGIAMERHEVGPLETGRRVVDVIGDRFS